MSPAHFVSRVRYVKSARTSLDFHAGGRAQRMIVRSVTSARIVAHYHSLYEESGSRRIRTAAATDAVIANSAATAETVAGSKTFVVHQGIEVRPRGAPDVWGNIRIGVAARLAAVKGLVTLLEALALLGEDDPVLAQTITLEIAGHGADEPMLRAKIAELGIDSRVRLLGWRNLLALPGRLTRSARQRLLHLPTNWPWAQQFLNALARLRAVPRPG